MNHQDKTVPMPTRKAQSDFDGTSIADTISKERRVSTTMKCPSCLADVRIVGLVNSSQVLNVSVRCVCGKTIGVVGKRELKIKKVSCK